MKALQVFSTAVLLLIPAAVAPAYGRGQREQEKQPEQKQEQQAKPARQPQRAEQQQQAKPAQQSRSAEHQQEAKPAQQSQSAEHRQQARPAQQQVKPAQPQQHAERQQQAKPAQQQPQRAQTQQRAGGTQQAGTHGRIPDDRFRASFGSSHTFHVSRSQFAGSSRRFQYGGYWFSSVDPWPVGWLYTDSVYVDYRNGGYFLCDPIHPGVFLSINIG
jgi:outer membrane biosynthesis protein TonB